MSISLAENLKNILEKFGFHPHIYIYTREKYRGEYAAKLCAKKSRTLIMFFDNIAKKLGFSYPSNELKYEK